MRCERLTLARDPAALASELRALIPAPESVAPAVAEIIAAVRVGGDRAVHDFTRRFDAPEAEPGSLEVGDADLRVASTRLEADVREGLSAAIANVRAVAEAALEPDRTVELGSNAVALRTAPVASAAVYVPGGRAPYPSTVVMGVVTARVAGVREVVVCSPPASDGEVSEVVLGACALAGASTVYRMGGAQAIAALAYGTESVAPVDMVVGPGNLFVQEAKRQVSDRVGIDGFAGPSDLVVIADPDVDLALPAADLIAQAEHGPGTLVIGVSTSGALLDELQTRLDEAPETGAVAALVESEDDDLALALAEAFAPEHLELIGEAAEALAARVTRAGCLFVGANAGTAFGDYIAGSNHILPTNGAARFGSALSAATFRRRFTEVRIEDPTELAKLAAPVARAEGFELHAESMESRIRENG
jgi:histidinol dehydrogenase